MRLWTNDTMNKMLDAAGIPRSVKKFTVFNDLAWEALGDWLYYRVHPDEKDSQRNRPLPDALVKSGWKKDQTNAIKS